MEDPVFLDGALEFAQQVKGRGMQAITGAEVTLEDGTHLTLLAEMVQSGKLKTVIDRTYKSLSEVPDAIRYLEEGHARACKIHDHRE